MTLFVKQDITLHSGQKSNYKIECDNLTDDDIETLAMIGFDRFSGFSKVVGVPRGGMRLAKALEKYIDPTAKTVLIVDDVMTTGASMIEMKDSQLKDPTNQGLVMQGLVLFSRTPPPNSPQQSWITPIFRMWS